jgi:RND family efflux transporter MFP subunit
MFPASKLRATQLRSAPTSTGAAVEHPPITAGGFEVRAGHQRRERFRGRRYCRFGDSGFTHSACAARAVYLPGVAQSALRRSPRTKRRLAALIALPLALACGSHDPGKPGDGAALPEREVAARAPVHVETARVSAEALTATIVASGTIKARRISEIGADVPGTLAAVFVDVGDVVAAGAPLFRIDPVPYQMALADERAGLALARAESANAVAETERMAKLVLQSAASQQRADQLRTQAQVADARVAQAAARVARAERDLARTTVRAPYAGSVVERRAHEGALAGPAPVVVFQESGALEAILDVPETTPVSARVGDPVRLFVQGVPGPISSKVSRVNGRVDSATRTYEVRCAVANPSGAIKAGSYARAEIEAIREAPRPVAPRAALVMHDGRSIVFRVEGGVAREQVVTVGITTDTRVELLEGVALGDLLVNGDMAQRLADGTSITTGADSGKSALAKAAREAAP